MITLTFRRVETFGDETLSREVKIDLGGVGIGEHIEAFIDALHAFGFSADVIKRTFAEFGESAQ